MPMGEDLDGGRMRLDREGLTQLLREALDAHASDIHLKAASRPALRIGDDLVAMAHPVLRGLDTERAAGVLLRMADKDQSLCSLQEATFVLATETMGRMQVRIFRQRGELGILVRPLPQRAPSLIALGVPLDQAKCLGRPGLVLVSGVRRHFLVSALVDAFNRSARGHVLMLENPILAFHEDVCAQVSQREVGRDTASWETGIESAMEQDVDVLVLSDRPGIKARKRLLQAAEEGRTVLASVPAAGPDFAVESFLDGFDGEERRRFSERLQAVLQDSMGLGRTRFMKPDLEAVDQRYSAA
jgi:twitching motility protein PilT